MKLNLLLVLALASVACCNVVHKTNTKQFSCLSPQPNANLKAEIRDGQVTLLTMGLSEFALPVKQNIDLSQVSFFCGDLVHLIGYSSEGKKTYQVILPKNSEKTRTVSGCDFALAENESFIGFAEIEESNTLALVYNDAYDVKAKLLQFNNRECQLISDDIIVTQSIPGAKYPGVFYNPQKREVKIFNDQRVSIKFQVPKIAVAHTKRILATPKASDDGREFALLSRSTDPWKGTHFALALTTRLFHMMFLKFFMFKYFKFVSIRYHYVLSSLTYLYMVKGWVVRYTFRFFDQNIRHSYFGFYKQNLPFITDESTAEDAQKCGDKRTVGMDHALMGCNFLDNYSVNFGLIIILLIICIIVTILNKCCGKKIKSWEAVDKEENEKLQKYKNKNDKHDGRLRVKFGVVEGERNVFNHLDDHFGLSFFCSFLYGSAIEGLVYIFIQLKTSYSTSYMNIGLICAIVLLALYALVFIAAILHTFRVRKGEVVDLRDDTSSCFFSLNKLANGIVCRFAGESCMSRFTVILDIIRIIALPFLVVFYDEVKDQAGVCVAVEAVFMLYVIFAKGGFNRWEYLIECVTPVCPIIFLLVRAILDSGSFPLSVAMWVYVTVSTLYAVGWVYVEVINGYQITRNKRLRGNDYIAAATEDKKAPKKVTESNKKKEEKDLPKPATANQNNGATQAPKTQPEAPKVGAAALPEPSENKSSEYNWSEACDLNEDEVANERDVVPDLKKDNFDHSDFAIEDNEAGQEKFGSSMNHNAVHASNRFNVDSLANNEGHFQ